MNIISVNSKLYYAYISGLQSHNVLHLECKTRPRIGSKSRGPSHGPHALKFAAWSEWNSCLKHENRH